MAFSIRILIVVFLIFQSNSYAFSVSTSQLIKNNISLNSIIPNEVYIVDAIETKDGNFVVLASGNDNLYLYKFNNNGALVWSKNKRAMDVSPQSLIENSVSDIVVFAVNHGADGIKSDMVRYVVNQDGEISNSVKLGGVSPEFDSIVHFSAIQAFSGDIVLSGTNFPSGLFIKRINSSYMEVWTKTYPVAGVGNVDVSSIDDSSLFIAFDFLKGHDSLKSGATHGILMSLMSSKGNFEGDVITYGEIFDKELPRNLASAKLVHLVESGGGGYAALVYREEVLSKKRKQTFLVYDSEKKLKIETNLYGYDSINKRKIVAVNEGFVIIGTNQASEWVMIILNKQGEIVNSSVIDIKGSNRIEQVFDSRDGSQFILFSRDTKDGVSNLELLKI